MSYYKGIITHFNSVVCSSRGFIPVQLCYCCTVVICASSLTLVSAGEISHIHPNGRINYVGQLPTRADGSDVGAEAALMAAERLQRVAERLALKEEQQVKQQYDEQDEQQGSESDLEDELDRALDDVLDAEMADGDGDDYSDGDVNSDCDSEAGADAAEDSDEYAYGWDDADESVSEKGARFGVHSDGEHNSSSEGSDEEVGDISQVCCCTTCMLLCVTAFESSCAW